MSIGIAIQQGIPNRAPAMFLGFQTKNVNASTNAVGDLPAGVQNGDLLVAIVAVGSNPSVTQPVGGGWTLLETTAISTSREISSAWKIASNEPASYTWVLGGAQSGVVAIAAYRAPSAATVEAHSAQGNTSPANAIAPSQTSLGGGRILVAAFCAVSTVSLTAPGTMTQRVNVTNNVSLLIADELVNIGATGTRTAGMSGNSNNVGSAFLVAVA